MGQDSNNKSLTNIILTIVKECVQLKNKYIDEKNTPVDWVCIFTQSDRELKRLTTEANTIGIIIEKTYSGLIYKFKNPPATFSGSPKVFKIRIPDQSKQERGDADFNTNYTEFKKKYLGNKNFKLIEKERFEMLELMDKNFNVRAYFSSIPPSKLRNV